MSRKHKNNVTIWRFRREITLGTVLHMMALLVMIIATWSNLQKELALIHHDLNRLVSSNIKLHEHIEKITDQCLNHEYRIKNLETIILQKTVIRF